ncbi:hypothetical protein GR168_10740 [Gordonia sp. JH63]|uniref:Ig-like domain-containing protein n=1 Tax=Gordonia sp. JH63 TaxID=2698900 RepID=UPI00131FF5C2|nr:Ig-like domain-containing protein [Gordonia sp. JH63]QHD85806.1 hypothetical protein GR168_10740 [Gordonia sp. JH63]
MPQHEADPPTVEVEAGTAGPQASDAPTSLPEPDSQSTTATEPPVISSPLETSLLPEASSPVGSSAAISVPPDKNPDAPFSAEKVRQLPTGQVAAVERHAARVQAQLRAAAEERRTAIHERREAVSEWIDNVRSGVDGDTLVRAAPNEASPLAGVAGLERLLRNLGAEALFLLNQSAMAVAVLNRRSRADGSDYYGLFAPVETPAQPQATLAEETAETSFLLAPVSLVLAAASDGDPGMFLDPGDADWETADRITTSAHAVTALHSEESIVITNGESTPIGILVVRASDPATQTLYIVGAGQSESFGVNEPTSLQVQLPRLADESHTGVSAGVISSDGQGNFISTLPRTGARTDWAGLDAGDQFWNPPEVVSDDGWMSGDASGVTYSWVGGVLTIHNDSDQPIGVVNTADNYSTAPYDFVVVGPSGSRIFVTPEDGDWTYMVQAPRAVTGQPVALGSVEIRYGVAVGQGIEVKRPDFVGMEEDFWDPMDDEVLIPPGSGPFPIPADSDDEFDPQFVPSYEYVTLFDGVDVSLAESSDGASDTATVTNTGGKPIYVLHGINGYWVEGVVLAPGESQTFAMPTTGMVGPDADRPLPNGAGYYPIDDYGYSGLYFQGPREEGTGRIVALGSVAVTDRYEFVDDDSDVITRFTQRFVNVSDRSRVDWTTADPDDTFFDPHDSDWPRTTTEQQTLVVESLDGTQNGLGYEYFPSADPGGQRLVLHNDGDDPIAVTVYEVDENGPLITGFVIVSAGETESFAIPADDDAQVTFDIQGPRAPGGPTTYGSLLFENGELNADLSSIPYYIPPGDPENTAPVITSVVAGSPPYTWTVHATDADGEVLAYSAVDGLYGTVTRTTEGVYTYTPLPGIAHHAAANSIEDSFTVIVRDPRGGTARQTVQVSITPENTFPTANLVAGQTNPETGAITYRLLSSDADNDQVTMSVDQLPAHGVVVMDSASQTITYTPDAGYRHLHDYSDTFVVIVNDGHGGHVPITTDVAVAQQNEAPTILIVPVSTDEVSGSTNYTVTTIDPDGDTVTVSVDTSPEFGILTANADGTFTYTPSAEHAEEDILADGFTLVADDGLGGVTEVTQVVYTNVVPDQPTTPGQQQAQALVQNLVAIPVRFLNTITNALAPIIGPGGLFQNDFLWAFASAVNNNVQRLFANSSPTLAPVVGPADSSGRIAGTAGGNDPDGDPLVYSVPTSGTGAPSRGVVSIDPSTGQWLYTPFEGHSGLDTFTLVATEAGTTQHIHRPGDGPTASAVVNLIVPAVQENRSPTIAPTIISIDPQTGLVTGSVGAVDPDGDPLKYRLWGSVFDADSFELDPDGTFRFLPSAEARYSAASTYGEDLGVFTVIVTDNRGGRATGRVLVPITPVVDDHNTAPVLNGVTIDSVDVVSGVVTGRINVADANGDDLRFRGSSSTALGQFNVGPTGRFQFTPSDIARDYATEASEDAPAAWFTVLVDDKKGGTVSVPVVVPIVPTLESLAEYPAGEPGGGEPGGGEPGTPGNQVAVYMPYMDFRALPAGWLGSVPGYYHVETVAAVLDNGRDVIGDPYPAYEPCETDCGWDYAMQRLTRNPAVSSFVIDPETDLPVIPDVYALYLYNPPGTFTNGYVVGYQKIGSSADFRVDYPSYDGFTSYTLAFVRPGEFPTEFFGPGAGPSSGGFTNGSPPLEKTQRDFEVEDLENVQEMQAELQRNLAAFDQGVTYASQAMTAATPGGVVLKSVVIAGGAVLSGEVQTYQDIVDVNGELALQQVPLIVHKRSPAV